MDLEDQEKTAFTYAFGVKNALKYSWMTYNKPS